MATGMPASPAGLRVAAIALVIGAATVGIGLPVVFAAMGITTMEIAPGVDLMLILLPLVGIVDLILARLFWQRAKAMDGGGGSGPVVS